MSRSTEVFFTSNLSLLVGLNFIFVEANLTFICLLFKSLQQPQELHCNTCIRFKLGSFSMGSRQLKQGRALSV